MVSTSLPAVRRDLFSSRMLRPSASVPTARDLLPASTHIVFNSERLVDEAVKKYGYAPRAFQIAATESILNGKDTVVIAPTGSGKSFLFEAPLLLAEADQQKMVVVISPLKALQVEQADK